MNFIISCLMVLQMCKYVLFILPHCDDELQTKVKIALLDQTGHFLHFSN